MSTPETDGSGSGSGTGNSNGSGSDGGGGGGTAPPATPALPEPVPMQCAINGCDFSTHGRMPMVAPCHCEHIVCHKCLEVWAGMPNPAPCLACGAKEVAPFEVRDCSPATGVLVVLVAQLPVKDGYVALARSCARGGGEGCVWGGVVAPGSSVGSLPSSRPPPNDPSPLLNLQPTQDTVPGLHA
jgi:hypothetical protein